MKKKDLIEGRVSRHFLFNSLNSVISLCHKDPKAAAELVGEISTYLQKSLGDKAPLISLAEELEQVLSYMNIQKVRFSHRLEIALDLDGDIRCAIPPFTLQPLIENAIVHGALKRKDGGAVSLSVKKQPCSVVITVKDNGPGIPEEQSGLLLRGKDKRHSVYKVNLSLRTAGAEGLRIQSRLNEGTTVTIELPENLRIPI